MGTYYLYVIILEAFHKFFNFSGTTNSPRRLFFGDLYGRVVVLDVIYPTNYLALIFLRKKSDLKGAQPVQYFLCPFLGSDIYYLILTINYVVNTIKKIAFNGLCKYSIAS